MGQTDLTEEFLSNLKEIKYKFMICGKKIDPVLGSASPVFDIVKGYYTANLPFIAVLDDIYDTIDFCEINKFLEGKNVITITDRKHPFWNKTSPENYLRVVDYDNIILDNVYIHPSEFSGHVSYFFKYSNIPNILNDCFSEYYSQENNNWHESLALCLIKNTKVGNIILRKPKKQSVKFLFSENETLNQTINILHKKDGGLVYVDDLIVDTSKLKCEFVTDIPETIYQSLFIIGSFDNATLKQVLNRSEKIVIIYTPSDFQDLEETISILGERKIEVPDYIFKIVEKVSPKKIKRI